MNALEGMLTSRARSSRKLIAHAPTRDIAQGLDFRARLLSLAAEAARYNDVGRASALAAASNGDEYALDAYGVTIERALGIRAAGTLGGLGALGWNPISKIKQAANWVSDQAGDVVRGAVDVVKSVVEAPIDIARAVIDNPLQAVLAPTTLLLKPLSNTMLAVADAVPGLNVVLKPVTELAIKPLELTSDITAWAGKTIQREAVNAVQEVKEIAEDPWGAIQQIPGAFLRFNPWALSVNAVGQVTEVTGESLGIKPLAQAGSFVDKSMTDVGEWSQAHPIETMAAYAAAVTAGVGIGVMTGAAGATAIVGGIGSAASAVGGAIAGAAGAVAGAAGKALPFIGEVAGDIFGGGGGPPVQNLAPPVTTTEQPMVLPAPPGPIDNIMATIGALPLPAKIGGVALVGMAVYMLVTPAAPRRPMPAPRLAGYDAPKRKRKRRPTQRKRRRTTTGRARR